MDKPNYRVPVFIDELVCIERCLEETRIFLVANKRSDFSLGRRGRTHMITERREDDEGRVYLGISCLTPDGVREGCFNMVDDEEISMFGKTVKAAIDFATTF